MLILGQHRLTTWVFITISSMILVGDLTSCMSTMHQWTWGTTCCDWGMRWVPLWHPGMRPSSTPCMKGNSSVPVAWCGRVAVVWLEGCLEMVDSLTGTVFRATCQAEVRMPVRRSRKEPVTGRRAVWLQKHTQGGVPSREQQHFRRAALRTQQLEDSSMRPSPWRRKFGCCWNWKMHWPQHDDMPFARMITDAIGTSPQKRTGDMPVGYSGRATLRRKQCHMF